MGQCGSVFQKHGDEIRELELRHGTVKGRLFFAEMILSDVQEMVLSGSSKEKIICEIQEAKQLLFSVKPKIVSDDVVKLLKMSTSPEEFGYDTANLLINSGIVGEQEADRIMRRWNRRLEVVREL